ncbi:MAG: T9SS type A sorting domain-containing protein [Lewinellaceae bacterium]|nr:T9SS type A sorting domain-containing protein [Lewinellaceae bacterium]
MRYHLPLFGLLIIPVLMMGQAGFINHYDFDGPNAGITNMLLDGDTLYVVGIKQANNPPYIQGYFLAQMDTLGHVVKTHTYYDSLQLNYGVAGFPSGFIQKKDKSGFLFAGGIFQTTNGVVLKTNHQGDLEWIKEYPDPDSQQDYYNYPLEVDGGYLIIGRKYNKSTSDLFVRKINTNGEEIWEKKYGVGNGRQDFFNSVYVVNDNEIVIGSSTGSNQNVPWQQWKATVRIFAIDSLGVEKWSWESPQWLEETLMTGLHRTDKDNWIYLSTRLAYEPDGLFLTALKVVVRDSDFNLIKSMDLDDKDGQDRPYNMISLSDGGYLGVGTNYELVENPGVADEHFYAWMVRLDEEGDTLWQRRYLTFPDTVPIGTIQYLHSAVELPSGSIICAGYYDGFTYPKDWGILIKVDANGCVDTLGCGSISDLFQVEKPEGEVLVYPNPSRGDVTFSWPGSFASTGISIRIFDGNGRKICEIPVLHGATSVQWHTEGLAPGMYFYQMMSKERLIQSGKVILHGH